ncbi:MAG: BatD family protein [Candidatus Latescibacterota bacterium]
MRAWMAAALVLGLAVRPALAEIEFVASVDRTSTGQAEPIRLALTMRSSENITGLQAPELALGDFHVEGPARSTRVEMVNFSTAYTVDWIYTLYPLKPGRFTVGPARLRYGGKVYQTKPLAVEVVAGAPSRAVAPSQNAAPEGQAAGDFLFLRARADRRSAYVGQQVTISYDLLYRVPLENVGFREIPSFSGFWAKELFVAQQLAPRREEVRGVLYNAAPLRQMALFPTSAGRHRVDPLAIACDVPQRATGGASSMRRLLDDPFFGGATRTVLLRSEPVEIEVTPLPDAGRPTEFTGAVGTFALSVQAQPTEVAVGDPVTLRMEISGQGNLDAVKPPVVAAPGFKVYDPKLAEEPQVTGSRVGGRRTWEYILIPDRGGLLSIPPLRFAHFDPERGQYRRSESPATAIRVRGSGAPAGPDFAVGRTDVEPVGQDIRHIKADATELDRPSAFHRSPLYWLLLAAMPGALGGLVVQRRHHQRLQGDVAYARRRRARGRAGRRLKEAGELLDAGRGPEFHAEVQRAVLAFLADKLNLPEARLTPDLAAEALVDRGVAPEVADRLRELLVQCEFIRFAPASVSSTEMEDVLDRAGRLIGELEARI